MLDKKGFDAWAKEYDGDVTRCYLNKEYPFDGYSDVFEEIFGRIKPRSKVLDLGFGTAVLTKKIADLGCQVFGVDFSSEMVKVAKGKIPGGSFFEGDLNDELPEEVTHQTYDYIVSTYAFHHLSDHRKVEFLLMLTGLLKENGQILIGDTSFLTTEELEECRQLYGSRWDDDEIYLVASELIPRLQASGVGAKYKKISSCAGIMVVK